MTLVNGIGGAMRAALQGPLNDAASSHGGASGPAAEGQGSNMRGLLGDWGNLFHRPQAWVEQKDEFVIDPSGDDQRINVDPSGDNITINLFGNKITIDPSGDDITVRVDPSGDSHRFSRSILAAISGLFGR